MMATIITNQQKHRLRVTYCGWRFGSDLILFTDGIYRASGRAVDIDKLDEMIVADLAELEHAKDKIFPEWFWAPKLTLSIVPKTSYKDYMRALNMVIKLRGIINSLISEITEIALNTGVAKPNSKHKRITEYVQQKCGINIEKWQYLSIEEMKIVREKLRKEQKRQDKNKAAILTKKILKELRIQVVK